MKRPYILLPLISAIILIFASCKEKFLTDDGATWGTFYHIVYSSPVPLSDSIQAELAAIDAELSMFNPNSTITAVNNGVTDSVGVRFTEIFNIASQVWEVSGGRYDVTVAPLVDLWGFGTKDTNSLPTDSAIQAVLQYVGMGNCAISPDGIVVKKDPRTQFDFSSIAKGYGIDCIGRMFERNGVENYMIEIGGEILVKGHNPDNKPWRIQIDSPEGGMSHSPLTFLNLGPERQAVATSGNYRNFRTDSAGKQLGHIVSPVTGYPAETSIASATVLASWCAEADAIATAIIASCTPQDADRIIKKAGVYALVVDADLKTYELGNE